MKRPRFERYALIARGLCAALTIGQTAQAEARDRWPRLPSSLAPEDDAPPRNASAELQTSEPERKRDQEPVHGAIELNPLALFLWKFGANGELLLESRSALVVSAAVQRFGDYFHGGAV
jgi:hypothetical protein